MNLSAIVEDNYEVLENLLNEIAMRFACSYKKNEVLSVYTTWKIGGMADYFVKVENVEALREVLHAVQNLDIPWMILGKGSNMLIQDGGIRGVVIQLKGDFEQATFQNDRVIAGSGYSLIKLAMYAAKSGLSGLEFAGGIPGTIGGAVTMNAGAHGSDMSKVLIECTALDKDGTILTLKNEDLQFVYRNSIIKEMGYIVLAVELQLQESNKEEITNLTKTFRGHRLKTQPLKEPSCGSVFKNPLPKFAGQVVDELGMKGLSIGDAQISPLHGNFIVNNGIASSNDVLALIHLIQKRAKEELGIALETEVKIIGEPLEG